MKRCLLLCMLCATLFSVEVYSQNGTSGLKSVMEDKAVVAPKVPSMNIDGFLDDPGWIINQVVDKVVLGTPGIDSNAVLFGVAYNAEYLYIGLNVMDSIITPFEMGEVFIDGDNSGGPYGEGDLHLRFAGPFVQVIYPDTLEGILLGFQVNPLADGFTAELGILWSELGITPEAGGQIGFDLMFSDGDSGTGVDYMMAWNGDLQNYQETTYFGDLIFWPEKSVTATSVIGMTIDGGLDDAGWNIDNAVTNIIFGTPSGDINDAHFGLAYNADSLYIGLDVNDATLTPFEMGEIFIDGDNNDSYYGEKDLHLRFAGPYIFVIYPDTIMGINLVFVVKPLGDGYTAELAIPWSELGITPVENEQIGFDLILSDGDSDTGVDYMMAWNGSLQDYWSKSVFGNMVFGVNSGLNDLVDVSNQVSLYPNPTNGNVYISSPGDTFQGDVNIKVVDITGRTVLNDHFSLEPGKMTGLDASRFTTGTYFITITDNEGVKAIKKFIVE